MNTTFALIITVGFLAIFTYTKKTNKPYSKVIDVISTLCQALSLICIGIALGTM